MSLNHIVKATCPDCKKEFPFEVWQSVNVQLNPEMREKVLDHSIFNFKCPECGLEAHTDYPFLYNDMKNGFMIQYCPDKEDFDNCKKALEEIQESDSATGALNIKFLRIVTNYFQLVEKIQIFESGLDDRQIELLKVNQVKQLNANKPENHLAFAVFELRTHKNISPKNPIPTIVYINEEGEEVFDCPLSIIPGAMHEVRDNYDYLDDKSFVVDMNWAHRYIYSEKISSALFNVEFDENNYSDDGAALAKIVIKYVNDENLRQDLLNSLPDDEKNALDKASRNVSNDKVFEALQAFYRYTNLKQPLEEIRMKNIFPWHPQLGFRFSDINMNEFYMEYFNTTAEILRILVKYFIQALIHGAEFDPEYPFDFDVDCRDKKLNSIGVYWLNQMHGAKETDKRVLLEYYKEHKGDARSLAVKNMVVRYLYQFDLPEDDVLRIDPVITDKLWEQHEMLESSIYEELHAAETTEERKEEIHKMLLDHTLEIWKVSFEKYDLAKCFENIAGYWYVKAFKDNELFRKAYINQVISSAFKPNNFAMMYVKKQYKGDISTNEFKTYQIETGLPLTINPDLHKMIIDRLQEARDKNDLYGQVYYINFLYNFTDEKTDDALKYDSVLNDLLRKIEL